MTMALIQEDFIREEEFISSAETCVETTTVTSTINFIVMIPFKNSVINCNTSHEKG